MAFVFVYAVGLAALCAIGARALYVGGWRRVAGWGVVAALVAGIADLAENGILLGVVASDETGWLWASQSAALVKWVAVVPAVLVSLVVTLTVLGRAGWWVIGCLSGAGKPVDAEFRDEPTDSPWEANYFLPGESAGSTSNPTEGLESQWSWPDFSAGTWGAVLAPLGLGTLLWIVSALLHTVPTQEPAAAPGRSSRWRKRLLHLAGAFLALAALIAFVLVGAPLLARLVAWLPHKEISAEGAAAGGGVVALVVTLWNMVGSSNRKAAKESAAGMLRGLITRTEFVARALLSFAVVAGLVVAALLVLGAELELAVSDYLRTEDGRFALVTDPRFWIPAGGFLVALIFFDQTRLMSLHPFYKRRLATSFAIERGHPGEAHELDYRVPTLLSEFAAPAAGDGRPGPQLLICAAAHVSGPEHAPPGRRVTPFVFSHDWVGGPRIGYFPTSKLEQAVRRRAYGGDVTTLGAMAMSGAAFASAMGRHSGPFNALLGITNGRLGAWLPNPRYHARRRTPNNPELPPLERYRRPLPVIRRLAYWAREITGSYSLLGRFVYVTDGGHYDNSGLIELLRRGCTTIYYIDASGDSAGQGLAEAATLAYEELGVRIEVAGAQLVPLPAPDIADDDPILQRLTGRLASSAVLKACFAYPNVGRSAGKNGTLYVGKAVLTSSAPFPVLAHAVDAADFPNDATADQWFDARQFEAYRALGRWVAQQLPDL